MDTKHNFIELYTYLLSIKNTKKCIKIYNPTMIEKEVCIGFPHLNIIFTNKLYQKQRVKFHELYYPLISIIIPCYNIENYISKCLDSILEQTYDNFEIICCNDCSSDSTKEILDVYSTYDKRIRVINNTKNSGPSGARNSAYNEAKGDYITFVDPDDYLGKYTLSTYIFNAMLYNKNVIMNCCRQVEITEYKNEIKTDFIKLARLLNNGHLAYSIYKNINKVSDDIYYYIMDFSKYQSVVWLMFAKKDALDKIIKTRGYLFNVNIRVGEDWDLTREFLSTYKPFIIDAFGYVQHFRKGSLVHDEHDNTI